MSQLEADGNRVIVGKQGDTSPADANVVSVNRGAPIRGTIHDHFGNSITGYVYYVNVR